MRKTINCPKAPPAQGKYSHACVWNDTIYISGQISLDTQGKLIGDDVTTQTNQVLTNAKNILEEAGSALENVLKASVFLKDMSDFGKNS